jgi:hypothetical protein
MTTHKSFRDYINLIESAQQGVAEGYEPPTSAKGSPAYRASLLRKKQERQAAADAKKKQQGVAEGLNDTIYPNAEVIKSKNGKPIGEIYQDASGWGCFHYKADNGADSIESREEALEWLKDLHDEYRQDRSLR